VLGGLVVLRRTIGGAGRAPDLEYASQTLIVLLGLWLLWRACHSHAYLMCRVPWPSRLSPDWCPIR
jgi:ABC-type nickel/cobalt efflux system permease component RcnA